MAWNISRGDIHYNDVIMSAMASQITSLTIVYSTVYSGADRRKHQSSVSLAFVRGIHRRPVNSPHKGPVTRKMFPFDDVIMFKGMWWLLITLHSIKRMLVYLKKQKKQERHICDLTLHHTIEAELTRMPSECESLLNSFKFELHSKISDHILTTYRRFRTWTWSLPSRYSPRKFRTCSNHSWLRSRWWTDRVTLEVYSFCNPNIRGVF